MPREFLVLPGTRIFELRICPIDAASGMPDRSRILTLFRAPEYICEPDPNAPRRPRSRVRFFAQTCGPWIKVLRSLCPTYALVPDVSYSGTGTRPWIWEPVHRQQLRKVTLSKVTGEMVPSDTTEWFDTPIAGAFDLERIHGRKAVSGGLGITSEGAPGTWKVYTRPKEKVHRRLISGTYEAPRYEEGPNDDIPEVVNGLLLRKAVLEAHSDGLLPTKDSEGHPLFTPEDYPDLTRACSTDESVNPLLNKPIEWKVRLIKFEDQDDGEVTPASRPARRGGTPQGGAQYDDLGREVRFV